MNSWISTHIVFFFFFFLSLSTSGTRVNRFLSRLVSTWLIFIEQFVDPYRRPDLIMDGFIFYSYPFIVKSPSLFYEINNVCTRFLNRVIILFLRRWYIYSYYLVIKHQVLVRFITVNYLSVNYLHSEARN